MAVQQVIRALGSWSLSLRDVPQDIYDQLDQWRFGHIAIDVARENPSVLGDALLDSCRYAGVLIATERDGDTVTVGGTGMAFWLGSADKVGDVFETAREFTAAPFDTVIAGLLPSSGAVTAGSIEAPTFGAVFPDVDMWPGEDVYPAATPEGVAGSYTGRHQWQSPREAVDYVSDLFGCDWRVNNNATLDAGDPSSLFVTTPTAAIVRRAEGGDQDLRGLPGSARLGRDVEDFSTRVINLAEGNGRTVAVGTADIDPMLNPYLDLHGNPVKLARILSESNTSKTNANARAALALAAYTAPRDSLDLSTDAYDIRGDIAPGDSVWVYDPDAGLVNTDEAVQFRGEQIHPVSLRVFSLTWPVTAGMGVYFRTGAGEWIDLTDWVQFERGGTQVTVGGYDRSLTNTNREAPGSRVVADSSVPGVPALIEPFATSVYQSTGGASRARITASWTQPTNTDGTTIVDGARYEVGYRSPAGSGAWSQAVAPFDDPTVTIRELLPATAYGLRVRAVDSAVPPNNGAWSSEVTTTTAGDTIAPATPAVPTVAGNPVSIQVKHTLGAATGGTYNLASDLRVLEVHASEVGDSFTPDATTKLGNLTATHAMLLAQVPAIGTFSVASTATLYIKVIAVDESGNASTPSAAATVTATLISDIYVSNVSATKLSAGDFTATYGVTGLMISGNPTGARFESGTRGLLTGMRLYRPAGTLALSGDASTGDLRLYAANGTTATMTFTAATGAINIVGTISTGQSGRRVVVSGTGNDVRFYPQANETRFARLYSYIPINYPDDIAVELVSIDSDETTVTGRVVVLPDSARLLASPRDTPSAPLASFQAGGDGVASIYAESQWQVVVASSGADGFVVLNEDQFGFFGFNDGANRYGYQYSGPSGISRQRVSVEADVTSPDQSAYRPMKASAFPIGSSATIKRDFAKLPGSALAAVRQAPGGVRWRYVGDEDDEPLHIGPIAETLPSWLVRPARTLAPDEVAPPQSDTVDVVSLLGTLWEAVRELDADMDDVRTSRGRPLPSRRDGQQMIRDIVAGRLPSRRNQEGSA